MTMKKIYLILTCLLCFHCISAQVDSTDNNEETDTVTDMAMPSEISVGNVAYPHNIFKLNMTSLVFRNISLQYERILAPRMSVALGLRLMPKGQLSFVSALTNAFDDETTDNFMNSTHIGGFAFTPEFRYYMGKGYGKGFYLAPFLRYEHFNLQADYQLDNDNGSTTTIPFTGHIGTFGVGLLIGSQFNLGQHLSLDWWILGPYYTANKLNLEASNLNLTDDEANQLQAELDDADAAWFKLKANVTNMQANASAKGSFAAIRGFGLCLGYKF